MTTAAIALTGWSVIVAVLLRANHLAHHKPAPEPTVDLCGRPDYPPPVPVAEDWTWLTSEPIDVWLTDELADRLFDDLIALEGLQ